MQSAPTPPSTTADALPRLRGGWPIVGHMLFQLFRPMEFLAQLRRLDHDLAWVNVGRGRWGLYCMNPDAYEVLKDKSCSVQH